MPQNAAFCKVNYLRENESDRSLYENTKRKLAVACGNERDELILRVFPQLRRLCAERGVTFTEVDLRWGVTEEEAAEGKVLPICLAEIERCRPFFIGLLGESGSGKSALLANWAVQYRAAHPDTLVLMHFIEIRARLP
jgi:hypothetical protein